jgi:hypothetical protein
MRMRIHYALASDNADRLAAVLNRGMAPVPDTNRFGSAEMQQLAKLQAQAYKNQIENPTKGSQEALSDIGTSLREGSSNTQYLKTFFGAVPPGSVGKLAILLHKQHKEKSAVLDRTDQKIIGDFGAALASASRKNVLPRQVADALWKSDGVGMWSSAMLLKFGPSGKEWSPEFLAGMSKGILAWSRRQRDAYMPHPVPSSTLIKYGKEWDDTEQWALDLVLTPEQQSTYGINREGAKKVNRNWDPVVSVLKRATENGTAARLALGNYKDPQGSVEAMRNLIDPLWLARHPSKELEPQVDAFLREATTARRGGSDEMRMAAQAFSNILDVVSHLPASRDGAKVVIPPDTRHTLTVIAGAYGLDLARSMDPGNAGNGAVTLAADEPYWISLSNPSYVQTFLNKVLIGTKDLGYFKGVTDTITATAVQLQSAGKVGDQDLVSLVGRLQAARQLAENAHRLEGAQEKDRQARIRKTAFNFVLSYFGQIPTVGYGRDPGKEHAGLQATQQLVTHTQPLMDLASSKAEKSKGGIFYVGNEELTRQVNQASIEDTRTRMRNLAIQGLIRSGALKAPEDPTWLRRGVVVPIHDPNAVESNERTNLDAFAGSHARTVNEYLNDVMNGFNAVMKPDRTGVAS